MAFYEPQAWQAPARQPSWEQPAPPSRSGASSASQREDSYAFASQFEEVDRAIDNLVKSGKFYTPGPRREPMAMGGGRHANDFSPRSHGTRHSAGSDFDSARSQSASNLQNFYASQRFQGGRGSEAEQMLQAKRRMAAQRERELRNYHQEQQYNRSLIADLSSTKSDRSMSPSTMSEEGRRELIARQHRALYGAEAPNFLPGNGQGENSGSDFDSASNVAPPSAGGMRGNSPRDAFGMGQSSSASKQGDGSTQNSGQESSHGDQSTSPAAGTAPTSFGTFDAPNLSSGKPASPPRSESPSRPVAKATTAPIGSGVGPIGSRPATQQAPNPGLTKRSTTPLTSPLSFGFGNAEAGNGTANGNGNNSNNNNSSSSNERADSSNSNTNAPNSGNSGAGAWGTGSGVWGSNKIGTTSVWG